MVRAKFICTGKTEQEPQEANGPKGASISLYAVQCDSIFGKFTPSGNLFMVIYNLNPLLLQYPVA